MTTRVGIIASRIRVEEKLLFAAFEQRGATVTQIIDDELVFDIGMQPLPEKEFAWNGLRDAGGPPIGVISGPARSDRLSRSVLSGLVISTLPSSADCRSMRSAIWPTGWFPEANKCAKYRRSYRCCKGSRRCPTRRPSDHEKDWFRALRSRHWRRCSC